MITKYQRLHLRVNVVVVEEEVEESVLTKLKIRRKYRI